jgi:Ca2+/Na+ antiporter
MKWLVLIAALVAIVLALQILVADLRHGHQRSTMGQLALTVPSLAVLGAAIYAGHAIGLFSVPIVAVAFVPFGLALRWSILATREMRQRRNEAGRPVPSSRSDRLVGLAMWPLFLVLVALVAVVGLMAGMLAAQR